MNVSCSSRGGENRGHGYEPGEHLPGGGTVRGNVRWPVPAPARGGAVSRYRRGRPGGSKGRGGGPLARRTLPGPRGELAQIQRTRARTRRGRVRSAARAGAVLGHLREQPGRVLHGPGGRAGTPDG